MDALSDADHIQKAASFGPRNAGQQTQFSGSRPYLVFGNGAQGLLPAQDVVALAASAGGLRALSVVLSLLPQDFPAGVLVVQHLDPRQPSFLAKILSRRTTLAVEQAIDHEAIAQGHVYIAPPNRHLLVGSRGRIALTDTEQVHFVRPSADLLFESAAAIFRERATAVVLSGSGVDGSVGVKAIKRMGGTVLVQKTPEFDGMPRAAIDTGSADQVLELEAIPEALVNLVARPETG